MMKLDEETKALIKGYVRELLNEERVKPQLIEVFTIQHAVRATVADPRSRVKFVDLPPGQYLVTNVETDDLGEEHVSLSHRDGTAYPLLVSKTKVGPTHLGKALFDK